MPCRALEAFRPIVRFDEGDSAQLDLNALSGIGGVQTQRRGVSGTGSSGRILMPCRALEAFRRTAPPGTGRYRPIHLNALSGIGGVQTYFFFFISSTPSNFILMPCRALEAFRLKEEFRVIYWDDLS